MLFDKVLSVQCYREKRDNSKPLAVLSWAESKVLNGAFAFEAQNLNFCFLLQQKLQLHTLLFTKCSALKRPDRLLDLLPHLVPLGRGRSHFSATLASFSISMNLSTIGGRYWQIQGKSAFWTSLQHSSDGSSSSPSSFRSSSSPSFFTYSLHRRYSLIKSPQHIILVRAFTSLSSSAAAWWLESKQAMTNVAKARSKNWILMLTIFSS